MAQTWNEFLAGEGDGLAAGASGRAALSHARASAVLCNLSDYGLIEFSGPDAVSFLHGQLSADVAGLPDSSCRLATYNSAKGRVLATLLLLRQGDGVIAQLALDIAEQIRKRLSMFILRSKVKSELVTARFITLGLGGPAAARLLETLGATHLAADFDVGRSQALGRGDAAIIDYLLRLPGNRYELLIASSDSAIAVWRELRAAGAHVASPDAWRWLSIQSGIADIGSPVQDQFVAQMLNYEVLGGISFTKGCYPGQEIIARTQYRGEIKRRTLLAHTSRPERPDAGTPVIPESGAQALGAVVDAAPAPGGGYDMLICIHLDKAREAPLCLAGGNAGSIELLPMPYKISGLV